MESGPHSEASRLLEAALEQMDGIIQGAKYELPNYGAEANNGHASSPAMSPSPSSRRGSNQGAALQAKRTAAATNGTSGGGAAGISKALGDLRTAILEADERDLVGLASEADEETVHFLARWLQNNPGPNGTGSRLFAAEERAATAESERDAAEMRSSLASEQLERQSARLADLEQLLAAKKELLRKTEQALERERHARRSAEEQAPPHLSEVARLKGRCTELERENEELRKICGGNRTPKYLPISPGSQPREAAMMASRRSPMDSSPDEPLPPRKEVGFNGQVDDIPAISPIEDEVTSPTSSSSGRPARGFKKIFGKIKRSNSGGHLEDNKRPTSPEFRRGGLRATAGPTLGDFNRVTRHAWDREATKTARPFSEWSVDTVCTWLECLGLGAYCQDVKKTVGNGSQLAAMSFSDLEDKLNVRHYLHRKKLYLALSARVDPARPDPEGALDFQWVLRWLDDAGLPQYKDAFLEARVDGRVLNVMTADDLFQLKVTNLLHHLSIKRGIQVLRSHNFDPDCLKRRATPGEDLSPASVCLWSNHRVMEWLKQVDLSEYAPNLRGSGVHGALLVLEPRFADGVLAAILSIPAGKTLLRRHLGIHFKDLVGRDVVQGKRAAEQSPSFVPLNPAAKAKVGRQGGQFTLKRKKSRSNFDHGDLLCPFDEQRQRQRGGGPPQADAADSSANKK